MLNVSNNIQFGFDVATSITIIATALTWILSTRKENRDKMSRGLSEKVKSTCLQTVQAKLVELENLYAKIYKIEHRISRKLNTTKAWPRKEYEFLARAKGKEHDAIAELQLDTQESLRECDTFYSTIKVRLFTLRPVLLSMSDSDDFLIHLERKVDRLDVFMSDKEHFYNEVEDEILALIKAVEHSEVNTDSQKELINTLLHNHKVTIDSILTKNYPHFEVVNRIKKHINKGGFFEIPNCLLKDKNRVNESNDLSSMLKNEPELQDYLKKIIESNYTLEDLNCYKTAFMYDEDMVYLKENQSDILPRIDLLRRNFLTLVIDYRHVVFVEYYKECIFPVFDACREVLISLSAITGKLVCKLEDRNLMEWNKAVSLSIKPQQDDKN